VQVRLHMLFLLFAACTLYLSWRYSAVQTDPDLGWLGPLSLLILLVSVLVHEFGHYVVAVRLGGGTNQLVLGPFGGLAPIRVPYEPGSELIAILSGPVVNLIVCLLCLAALLFFGHGGQETASAKILYLLNPLAVPFGPMHEPIDSTIGLELTLWINWVLFLLNLIPAFPFDGGRALMALLATAPFSLPARRSVMVVAILAKVVAIGLLIAAWLVRHMDSPEPVIPAWFALLLLSLFLFFSARVEESQQLVDEPGESLFSYDFSQGFTSLERADEGQRRPRGPFMRWLERRREQRTRRQRALEAEEDRRMDDVLARLHDIGLENLSAEDRALLIRVSARYRSRPPK
jgi:Zn-dependent protease